MKKSKKGNPAQKVLERFLKKVLLLEDDSNEISLLKRETKDLNFNYRRGLLSKREMLKRLNKLKSKWEELIIGI
jgi:hypothetical protein